MVNKAISEVVLKKWYDSCKYHLDCNQEQRIKIEQEIKQKKIDVPFLLAHEFLFLLCNTTDRLELIRRVHQPELVSVKGNINNWELTNKSSGSHQVTHIHLLGQTAFVNQAPHILITNTLNKEAEEKNIKVIGAKKTMVEELKEKAKQQANQSQSMISTKNSKNKSSQQGKLQELEVSHL